MEKIEITDEYIELVEAQFNLWGNFLNSGIGLLSFTLALASLGTNSPVENACLSFFIVIMVRIGGTKYFPAEILRLKLLSKTDKKASILYEGLMSKYLGFKSNFARYPIFIFGIFFLSLIMLSNQISAFIPLWGEYVGI